MGALALPAVSSATGVAPSRQSPGTTWRAAVQTARGRVVLPMILQEMEGIQLLRRHHHMPVKVTATATDLAGNSTTAQGSREPGH